MEENVLVFNFFLYMEDDENLLQKKMGLSRSTSSVLRRVASNRTVTDRTAFEMISGQMAHLVHFQN